MARAPVAFLALLAAVAGSAGVRAQDAPGSAPTTPDAGSAPSAPAAADTAAPPVEPTQSAGTEDVGVPPVGPETAPPETATPEAARPETRVPPPPAERVAVLLVPTGDVDPTTTDSLTELLISAVAARGVTQIVGKEELQALLGRDDAGILACVESGVCLGQVSVELGVREVVAGTLGERDGRWVFALARIDARTGETSGRVFREVEGGIEALVGSLASSVPELYVESVRPGRLVIEVIDARTGARVRGAEISLDDEPIGTTTEATFRRELIAPGPHALEVRSPRHATLARDIDVEEGATLVLDATLVPVERRLEISPLTWAPGIAGLALLGVGIGVGVASQDAPGATLTMRQTFDFFDAREREAIAADVLYAVGGAALALGAVSLVLDVTAGSGRQDDVRVEVGGSGLTLRGALP